MRKRRSSNGLWQDFILHVFYKFNDWPREGALSNNGVSLVAGSLVFIVFDIDAVFGRSSHGVQEHGSGSPDQDALVHAILLLVRAPRARLALVLKRQLGVDWWTLLLLLLVQRDFNELLEAFAEGALGFGEACSRV